MTCRLLCGFKSKYCALEYSGMHKQAMNIKKTVTRFILLNKLKSMCYNWQTKST